MVPALAAKNRFAPGTNEPVVKVRNRYSASLYFSNLDINCSRIRKLFCEMRYLSITRRFERFNIHWSRYQRISELVLGPR